MNVTVICLTIAFLGGGTISYVLSQIGKRQDLDAKFSAGYSRGYEDGHDMGWVDRGLADWHKERERHDARGRFKAKGK